MYPLLTICIPTYNRSDQVTSLLKDILNSERKDIEVCVLDNASIDDTYASLRSLNDPRFTYKRNHENKGWHYNTINSLLLGNGKYSALLLDKDKLNHHYLDDFCQFLELYKPAGGFCEYNLEDWSVPKIFTNSTQKFLNSAYQCHHPTGYFYDKKILKSLKPSLRFVNPDSVGLFPFEFMLAEICCKGATAIYTKPLFMTENLRIKKNKKSNHLMTTNNAFFAPSQRSKLSFMFLRHSFYLKIPPKTIISLIPSLFRRGLRQVTIEYKYISEDQIICDHYNVSRVKITKVKMVYYGLKFATEFIYCLIIFLLGKETPASKILINSLIK